MKKTSVSIIFLTVVIDLIGFGLILPLIPIYGERFHASGWVIGAIVSAYSLMQFIFAPIWGRLSDRIGRRPVLLTSTCCACCSYVIFALGSGLSDGKTALAVIFVSRLFAGICGANITVAQAYIADITPPEKRSAKMGLVGMAFGLGFVFGPVLGGFSSKYLGPTAPGWTAASLCALNFIWAFIWLGESWKPAEHSVIQRPHIEQWLHTLRTPRLNLLIGIFFLATFCFTCFEVTIGLLIIKNFNIDTTKSLTTVSWLIAYCGVVGASVQSPGMIGRMVKRLGEPKLIATSLFRGGRRHRPAAFSDDLGIAVGWLGHFRDWFQPHSSARLRHDLDVDARQRARGDDGRDARRGQRGPHRRPDLRRQPFRGTCLPAVSDLRRTLLCHFDAHVAILDPYSPASKNLSGAGGASF